jgi:hypothetical protein
MGKRGLLVVVLAVLAGGAFATSASAETDVTGNWQMLGEYWFHNSTTPGGMGNNFQFLLEDSSGNFGGSNPTGLQIRGKVTGSDVRFVILGSGAGGSPYNEIYQGTITSPGHMSGYGAGCTRQSADPSAFVYASQWAIVQQGQPDTPVWSTTRDARSEALCADPLPPGPDFRHPSTTQAQCYRGAALADSSTCVVTVTDGTGQSAPRDDVAFTVPAGQGSVLAPASCALVPVSTATSTCRVTYTPDALHPATGATVPLRSAYVGDDDHKPSVVTSATLTVGPAPPAPPADTTVKTYTTPQCSDFAISNPVVPPGNYTGPNDAYGLDAQQYLYCQTLGEALLIPGGKFVIATLAAALNQLDGNAKWVQKFPTFVETPGGWQSVTATIQPWAGGQQTAFNTAVHDPPASSYKTLAKAKPAKVPLVRVSGSEKTRTTTKALNAWVKALATSRGLADAFTLTVNRAGGAKKAHSTLWQGRQMRLAITLAKQLAAQDAALVAPTRKLAALAAKDKLAQRGLSAKQLQKIRAKIAKSGLSKAQKARLKKLGYDSTALAAVVAAAKSTSVPTSGLASTPAKQLADPQLVTQLQRYALYFRLWPKRLDVLAEAALK